eukprot:1361986-Pyramimonas_sp.AAC.1
MESRSRFGLPYNSFRNSFLGALESSSRWRFVCNLLKNRAPALEPPEIYSTAALLTLRRPGVAVTLKIPSQLTWNRDLAA